MQVLRSLSIRRRGRFRPAFWLFLLVVAAGCGDKSQQGEPAADPAGGGPVAGGTAVVALAGEPDALNSLIRGSSYAGIVLAELQDALAELGEDLQWSPRIASGWEIAPDRLSITYHLRPWVWSDGDPLDAEDVVETFRLIRDERVASNLRGFYSAVSAVEAPDARTVIYHFSHAVPDPVTRSVHPLLPAHRIRDLDPAGIRSWDLNHAPLSSGAFRLESWEHNRSLVLVRNGNYPGIPAHLERVVFRIVPEEASRVLALESGEVDLVDGLPPTVARRLAASDAVRIRETGGRRFYYLLWNLENPIFRDAATRRALSLAIDRERLLETLVLGYGSLAASCIPPAMWNHDAALAADPLDPARARDLLAGAGWRDDDGDGVLERDGTRLRFTVITKQGDPIRENGLVILRENLQAVGAELVPRVLEHATGLAKLREGAFDAYLGRFNANLYGDPSALVQSDPWGSYNFGHYANARVDSLVDLGLSLVDRREALPVWYRLQEELVGDPPAAYLFYPRQLVGVSSRLRDVRPHMLSPVNNLTEWWIAEPDRKYRSALPAE